jgi:hypothetical protein
VNDELLRTLWRWSADNVMPGTGWAEGFGTTYHFGKIEMGKRSAEIYFDNGEAYVALFDEHARTLRDCKCRTITTSAKLVELLEWVTTPVEVGDGP